MYLGWLRPCLFSQVCTRYIKIVISLFPEVRITDGLLSGDLEVKQRIVSRFFLG